MAQHAVKCFSMHYKDKYIEKQYAVSESGKIFTRDVYHPNAHSHSGWTEIAGLPNHEHLRAYDTTHQIWILPG